MFAGIVVGAAIAASFAAVVLKMQDCGAFTWDPQLKEFVWQFLQPYQCSETSERVATRGTLIVGPMANSFSSADGRISGASLIMGGEGVQQALQGKFVGQPNGRAHSYDVAVQGVLYAAHGRQQLYAWAIEQNRSVASSSGR